MISKPAFISLRESCGNDERFVNTIKSHLGLCDSKGRKHLDRSGRPTLRFPDGVSESERIKSDEFNWRGLAHSVFGTDDNEAIRRAFNPRSIALAVSLQEAGEAAVLPSQLSNVNTLNAIYSGLIEASILEGYTLPEFVNGRIAPEESSKIFEGRKTIGITLQNPKAESRQPGQPTKRASVGERWITQPATIENALALELTFEAVFTDSYTGGGLMDTGKDVGHYVQLQREYMVIDAAIGATNSYRYKNNYYNTFLTGGYFTNVVAENPLTHWTAIRNNLVTARNMRAVEVGQPLVVNPTMILCNQEIAMTADQIRNASFVEFRDAPGSTSSPQNIRQSSNPVAGKFDVLTSPYLYERMTAADGLNMDASTAGSTWFFFEPGWLKWVFNWPFRVSQAIASDYEMTDRGLIAFYKADERGCAMVVEPRKVIKNLAA